MRVAITTAVLVAGGLYAIPQADAAADCVHRGPGHVLRHGGQAEDDRFHIMHGELPSCGDPDDGSGNDYPSANEPHVDGLKKPRDPLPASDNRHDDSRHHDEGKSRFCRKHWEC